jgi:hypothetical protein
VKTAQTTARNPFHIGLIQRIIQNEGDMTFGDAAMGAQGMLTERRQIVRGGRRSYACSVIAYDHDAAFAVDRQIE